MDVEALQPGVDFVERIETAVGSADALLVVVGRGWLGAKDGAGQRRLDDPDDFVRLEVGTALRGDPVVIPVLVGGATMPEEEELPGDLALLARRNAVTLIDTDWRSGMARLVAALEQIREPETSQLPPPPPPPERREEERGPPLLATILGLAGAGLLVLGTVLRADEVAHPGLADTSGVDVGFFTSLAPTGLVVGALGALALSYSRGSGRIGTGLLLGFALAGVAWYVGVLVTAFHTTAEESSRLTGGAALALLGCLLLAAAAVPRIAADREDPGEDVGWLPRVLVLAGVAIVVAGTIVPFNDGPRPQESGLGAVIDRDGGWEAFAPIAIAVLAGAASFFLTTGRSRLVACGAIIGLGAFATLLWVRYLAVPMLQPDTISSVAPGAFLGFGGAVAILAGGLVARTRLRSAAVPGGVPAGRAT